MKRTTTTILTAIMLMVFHSFVFGQAELPFKYEELTSPLFVKAVEKAQGVCVIPMGVLEKHGPHLPLGADVFESRENVFTAAKQEYAIVFPTYFAGQIFEAKHQPGTIAYSNELLWKLLDETCRELSRNGLKKIILFNGHGGNSNFLQYFCQSQLSEQKDYVVVLFQSGNDQELDKEIRSLRKATLDSHAGEGETSMMTVIRPDIVDIGALKTESGLSQDRLDRMPFGYTGIWWYARFPNHFASDVAEPNKRLGELMIAKNGKQLAELIRYLKKENSIKQLQDEFFRRSQNPFQK